MELETAKIRSPMAVLIQPHLTIMFFFSYSFS